MAFFEEKLSNPETNRPIKSGFFNQMADYIDYDKHCCRSYFKRNLGFIFARLFRRSAEDCAKFLSYLEKKKKSIRKKKPSNVSLQVQKIRRRLNRQFRDEAALGNRPSPESRRFGPDRLLFHEPLARKTRQMMPEMADADAHHVDLIGSPTSRVGSSHLRGSAPNIEHIFVEESGNMTRSLASSLPKWTPSNAMSTLRLPLEAPGSFEELSVQRVESEHNGLFDSSPNIAKSVILEMGQSDGQLGSRMCVRSMSPEARSLQHQAPRAPPDLSLSLEADSGSLAKNPVPSLCQSSLKINLHRKKQSPENAHLRTENCVCTHCACEEDYLIRKMNFDSHSKRIKITPEIFDSIQRVRICLDCLQPVLKGVDKDRFVVQSRTHSPRASLREEIVPAARQEQAMDGVFLKEASERIVSDSNSQDNLKFELPENAKKIENEDFAKSDTLNIKTVKINQRKQFGRAQPRATDDQGKGREELDKAQLENLFDKEFDRNLNHLETAKPRRGEQLENISSKCSGTLVKEIKLSGPCNQIDQIKEDIERFQSVGDFERADSDWIRDERADQLETASMMSGLGRPHKGVFNYKITFENDELKNLIQNIRADTFAK